MYDGRGFVATDGTTTGGGPSQLSDGHVTRLMGFLGTPFKSEHSLSGWLMMLALGGIAVFIWTRILKYIKGE